MSGFRRLLSIVVTLGLAWALAASSAVSTRWHDDTASELRLSWNARPERIETCRIVSSEELARRPAHMRQQVICEGTSASYALLVVANGDTLDQSVIRGGGLRGDRPILLMRDFPLPEGEHTLHLRFTRREVVDSTTTRNAIPADLVLDTVVSFRRGEVILVIIADGALRLTTPVGSR